MYSSFRPYRPMITPRTYVRDLPYSVLQNVARQLDPDGTATTWRDLARKIPQGPMNPAPRFSTTDIKHFEMCAQKGTSATLTLLGAWATSNVTAQDLVNVLYTLNLPKLADMILPRGDSMQQMSSQPMFQAPPSYEATIAISREPAVPPGLESKPKLPLPTISNASVTTTMTNLTRSGKREPIEHESLPYCLPTENCISDFSHISEQLSLEDLSLERNLPSFSYSDLSELTSNFNDSCKLGEGAFGSVFSGRLNIPKEKCCKSDARKIAIKRLKLDAPDLAIAVAEQFKKEIHIISELEHDNILPLIGYSCDGPELCLVYDFMFNGSLSLKLQNCREFKDEITVKQRVQIAEGSAAGIEYLHNKKLVHRDIKSSNILLDMENRPRISDFGLIRSVYTARDKTSTVTTKPIGTPMYMAPEAYRGEVSTAMDVFGFGIVLLELLTGMVVCDPDRDPQGLDNYIMEVCEDHPEVIFDHTDCLAGTWNPCIVLEFYNLASESLNYYRKKRPNMSQILKRLKDMNVE